MKEFNDMEDLEQLLKPQCEFHASDTLKDEVIAKAKAEARPRKVRLLPWLAAACVAGFLTLYLMPPEKIEENTPAVAKVENPVSVLPKTEENEKVVAKVMKPKVGRKKIVKKAKVAMPMPQEEIRTVMLSAPPITLTERDIPITRPENLIDTPEDLEQIAKIEKEEFISRLRAQVEIARAEVNSYCCD